jgi:hypothetical protein
MKDILKIEEIKIIGKYKVNVSYKFFNDIHKESKIEFDPRHGYTLGSYPVIRVDEKPIDIGPDQYISVRKRPFYQNKSRNYQKV